MRRALLCCLLLAWPAGLAAPARAADPAPLTLAETRPLETSLGNPALAATPAVWLDMIHSAKSSLDLEEYYLSERRGEALTPVLQAIGEAAARGVKVRLLLDAGMHRTYPLPADSLGRLARSSAARISTGARCPTFTSSERACSWRRSRRRWRTCSSPTGRLPTPRIPRRRWIVRA
jgi:hypothetical protein